jgi:ABC-type antimicrobial peptide transport system permease subunit
MHITKIIIITFTTFILFLIEALFHFNIGKNGHKIHKKFEIVFPTKQEMAYIVGVLAVFSICNGLISHFLIHALH